MILREREAFVRERGARAIAIKPRGRDEARDRAPQYIFEHRTSVAQPRSGIGPREPQELALPRRHMLRLPRRRTAVRARIAVEPAWKARSCRIGARPWKSGTTSIA